MTKVTTVHGLKAEVNKKITTEYSLNLSGADIRKILDLPLNAKVTVQIPGGGDWSNQELNINDEHTFDVKWQTIVEQD